MEETYKETDQIGICNACKEWANAVIYFDEDGNQIDVESNCCGDTIHLN